MLDWLELFFFLFFLAKRSSAAASALHSQKKIQPLWLPASTWSFMEPLKRIVQPQQPQSQLDAAQSGDRGLSPIISALCLLSGLCWTSLGSDPATASHQLLMTSWHFSCVSSWAGTHRRFCSGTFWWTAWYKLPRPSWWPHRTEGGGQGRDLCRSPQIRPRSDEREKTARDERMF